MTSLILVHNSLTLFTVSTLLVVNFIYTVQYWNLSVRISCIGLITVTVCLITVTVCLIIITVCMSKAIVCLITVNVCMNLFSVNIMTVFIVCFVNTIN